MIDTAPDNVAVHLQDGVTYVNGHGEKHTIEGATKVNPAWVYSRQGEWFVRETGQYVYYTFKTGKYETRGTTWRDLWKRAYD